MALINRLAGIDNRKLPINTFYALLTELAAGEVTKQAIIDHFALDAGEQTELDWLIQRYNDQPTAAAKDAMLLLTHTIFYLAEARFPGYQSNAEIVDRFNRI